MIEPGESELFLSSTVRGAHAALSRPAAPA